MSSGGFGMSGQAESGKSTTLKSACSLASSRSYCAHILFLDFQLAFTPAHFRNERLAWRTIIQLNLIRCVPLTLATRREPVALVYLCLVPVARDAFSAGYCGLCIPCT